MFIKQAIICVIVFVGLFVCVTLLMSLNPHRWLMRNRSWSTTVSHFIDRRFFSLKIFNDRSGHKTATENCGLLSSIEWKQNPSAKQKSKTKRINKINMCWWDISLFINIKNSSRQKKKICEIFWRNHLWLYYTDFIRWILSLLLILQKTFAYVEKEEEEERRRRRRDW